MRNLSKRTMPQAAMAVCAMLIECAILVLSQHPGYCAQDADAPPVGKITRYHMATSLVRPYKLGERWREVIVYTPPGYDDPANTHRRYAVFYLLHGSPGKPIDFIHNGHWPELMQTQSAQLSLTDAILVMPDGNYEGGAFGDSEWINSADNHDLFEDFVTKQLVAWTDENFRTIRTPDGRVIGGVSEGGYGSLNIALHHPEVFHNVLALSGYFRNDGSGWARKIMGRAQAFLSYNSPLDYVESVPDAAEQCARWRDMHIYIGAGENEKRYLTESRQMVTVLVSHKIPAVLNIVPGKHGWGLWNTLFIDGLTRLSTSLPGQASPSRKLP